MSLRKRHCRHTIRPRLIRSPEAPEFKARMPIKSTESFHREDGSNQVARTTGLVDVIAGTARCTNWQLPSWLVASTRLYFTENQNSVNAAIAFGDLRRVDLHIEDANKAALTVMRPAECMCLCHSLTCPPTATLFLALTSRS